MLGVTRRATRALSAAVVVEGCPDWCNDHNFLDGDEAGEDVSHHRHLVRGEGWAVEPEEGDAPGSVVLVEPMGEEIPLREARAYATALLTACDAVRAVSSVS